MALLQRYVRQPLVVNQLEFSLTQPALVTEGFTANQTGAGANSALASGLLDYCRLNDILVQAWSPTGGGKLFKPASDASSSEPHPAAEAVTSLAKQKNTTSDAILLAWILRHPAGIQPVLGTTNVDRILASVPADDVSLSREEWTTLLVAARGKKMP